MYFNSFNLKYIRTRNGMFYGDIKDLKNETVAKSCDIKRAFVPCLNFLLQ